MRQQRMDTVAAALLYAWILSPILKCFKRMCHVWSFKKTKKPEKVEKNRTSVEEKERLTKENQQLMAQIAENNT